MLAHSSQAVVFDEQTVRFSTLHLRRVLLILLVISVVAWSIIKLNDPQTLPITKIKAQGIFNHVTDGMLQKAMGSFVKQGYFSVDVDSVRQALEGLPWVDKAVVQRVWPDTLIIQLTEQQAFAIWADGGVLNTRGELFFPDRKTYPEDLPLLQGPQMLHESVVAMYRQISEALQALDLIVLSVSLNARRAVLLQLNNGVELVLGRHNKRERLQRFIHAYPLVLSQQSARIKRVDLRYTNGFSVQWKQTG